MTALRGCALDAPGYNPMRWDCAEQGCFNVKQRPKIEMFADIWPGRISMGDLDGIVEIAGNALILEWKSPSTEGVIPTGQRLMYERLTKGKCLTVLCVVGDAETMEVSAYKVFFDGKEGAWVTADFQVLCERLTAWRDYALKNGRV